MFQFKVSATERPIILKPAATAAFAPAKQKEGTSTYAKKQVREQKCML